MVYWVWLADVLGFASNKLKPLVQYFGSAERIFNADIKQINNVVSLNSAEIKRFRNKSITKAQKIISDCKASNIGIVCYNDSQYPDILRNIINPPACLYFKGSFPDFDNLPVISIVGTRNADEYSYKAAWSLSARLSLANCLIVSGGAVGIDSAAHKGALDVGADTVAVLACGINYNYLKKNEELRKRISENGCLISECPPDHPIRKTSFHIRNRLISGLSLGTVIVEAGEKSGALITARTAAEQGRDVFVITGKPDDKKYAGTNALLRDGAIPIFKFEDVLSEYYSSFGNIIDVEKSVKFNLSTLYNSLYNVNFSKQREEYIEKNAENATYNEKNLKNQNLALSKNAEIVYNYLDKDFFTVDDLSEVNLNVTEIFTAVTELELSGLVKAVPGGRYTKI